MYTNIHMNPPNIVNILEIIKEKRKHRYDNLIVENFILRASFFVGFAIIGPLLFHQ